jgi:uncharacterized membrane protein
VAPDPADNEISRLPERSERGRSQRQNGGRTGFNNRPLSCLLLCVFYNLNYASRRNMFDKRNLLEEKNIRLIFTISLILKGVFALLEVLGGIFAYFTSQQFLLRIVSAITQDELIEDPKDLIANYFLQSARQISVSSQHFIAVYLLSHGVIKLLLVIGLLRRKLWYYPSAILAFTLFILYQLYRFSYTHSIWLLFMTILDVVVIGLTWHEYKFLRRQKAVR